MSQRRSPLAVIVEAVLFAARPRGATHAVPTRMLRRRHGCKVADPIFSVDQTSGCRRMPIDERQAATVAAPRLCMVASGPAAVAGAMVRGELS